MAEAPRGTGPAAPGTRVITRGPAASTTPESQTVSADGAHAATRVASTQSRPDSQRSATNVHVTELDRYLGLMGITPAFAWPDAPPATPEGPTAGHLRVLGALGSGGLGEVLRVWDEALLRPVALKRMRPEHRRDPILVQAFLEEAMLAARLEHPNIVPVYTIGVTPEDGPFYTMKVLAGETLAEILGRLRRGDGETQRRYPLVRRVEVLVAALRAMAHAHARGVIHCDLKPSNVLVGPHGEVTLVDWGLALALGELGGRQARARMWSGSPGYMAPEQCLQQDTAALGTWSDVWALGAMLYEVLSLAVPQAPPGETAFRSPEAGWERVWTATVPLAQRPCAELPAALARICARALAEAPSERYTDAGAMAGELATWLEGRQDEERAARELAEAAAAADDAATWLASPEGETPEATGAATGAALTLAGLLAETPSAPLAVHRSASGLYWALVRWLHARAGRVAEGTPVHEAIEALAAAGVPEARTLGEDDWFAAMERLAGDGMPWVAALVTRMKRLASTPIFRDLRPNALRNVADAVEPCTFAPGAALMREGEPGDALYVLTRGVVAISALGEDASDPDAPWTERVLTRIEVPPGEARCVGEVAVVRRADGGGRVRTASVIAETEVAALRLGADRFERLAQRDGAVAMGLVRLLSERLASATARELGHELD